MLRKFGTRTLVLSVLLTAAIHCSGCRPATLTSVWYASTSGTPSARDWRNLPAYRVKKFPGRIIVANDSSNLHFGFCSPDRQLARRLRAGGLTLWLANPRNKYEKLGFRYPAGMRKGEGESPPNRFLPRENLPPSELSALFDLQHNDIEILTQDSALGGRKSLDEAARFGVQAELMEVDSAVEYMLTINVKRVAPWLNLGSSALLEVESPAMERSGPEGRGFGDKRGGTPGEMPPGGRGGDFPPARGGGPRRGPSEIDNRNESSIPLNRPIHLKFLIALAAKPVS